MNDRVTRRCTACGRSNGWRAVGPDLPRLPDSPGPCVWCRSDEVVWEYVAWPVATAVPEKVFGAHQRGSGV